MKQIKCCSVVYARPESNKEGRNLQGRKIRMEEDFNSEHVKNWIQNTFVVDKQDWSQLTSVTAYPL